MTRPEARGGAVRMAAARNHAEHNVAYAEAVGGRVLREDDVVAVDIGSPLAFLNAVVPLRPVEEGRVAEAAAAFFGERGDGSGHGHAGGHAGGHAVIDYFEAVDLGAAGYVSGEPLPVMVRERGSEERSPSGGPSGALAVERVADVDALVEFERVVIVGSELTPYVDAPPHSLWGKGLVDHATLRLYLGRVDGVPVTCAATVVEHDAVGVYAVSTLHEHRRRGYGGAITAAALDDAPPVLAVLTASPLGEGVYAGLGFEPVAHRRSWWRLA